MIIVSLSICIDLFYNLCILSETYLKSNSTTDNFHKHFSWISVSKNIFVIRFVVCVCAVLDMSLPEPTSPRRPVDYTYASPGPAVYKLPGLVGQTRHDFRSTHPMMPAWSIGGRSTKDPESGGPGPGAYNLNRKMTREGRQEAPAYSIGSRRVDNQKNTTPGPGAYAPEISGPSAYTSSPRYSMGTRT